MDEKFGISLLHMQPEQPLPPLSDVFDAVELPGLLLNGHIPTARLPETIFFNGLMPGELTREIAMQSKRIKINFLEQIAAMLGRAGQLGAGGVIIDFGLENCFTEEGRRLETISVIKRLCADLLRNDQMLYLPVRVPFMPEANGTSEPYLEFLKSLMCPQIGFAINVYPHELAGRELDLWQMLRWLQFDTGVIRFIYEAETGNRLVSRLVEPWLAVSRSYGWRVPFLVAPLMSREETLENELVILKEFFLTLKQENSKC